MSQVVLDKNDLSSGRVGVVYGGANSPDEPSLALENALSGVPDNAVVFDMQWKDAPNDFTCVLTYRIVGELTAPEEE